MYELCIYSIKVEVQNGDATTKRDTCYYNSKNILSVREFYLH